jgi:hypothetical protein
MIIACAATSILLKTRIFHLILPQERAMPAILGWPTVIAGMARSCGVTILAFFPTTGYAHSG